MRTAQLVCEAAPTRSVKGQAGSDSLVPISGYYWLIYENGVDGGKGEAIAREQGYWTRVRDRRDDDLVLKLHFNSPSTRVALCFFSAQQPSLSLSLSPSLSLVGGEVEAAASAQLVRCSLRSKLTDRERRITVGQTVPLRSVPYEFPFIDPVCRVCDR